MFSNSEQIEQKALEQKEQGNNLKKLPKYFLALGLIVSSDSESIIFDDFEVKQ